MKDNKYFQPCSRTPTTTNSILQFNPTHIALQLEQQRHYKGGFSV